jgi:hypothetical protein
MHYIVISLDNAIENEGRSKCAEKGKGKMRWKSNREDEMEIEYDKWNTVQ